MNFLTMAHKCPRSCQETALKIRAFCQTVGYRNLKGQKWLLINGLCHCCFGVLILLFGIGGILIKHALSESLPIWTGLIFFALGIYAIVIARKEPAKHLYKICFVLSVASWISAFALLVVAVAALTLQVRQGQMTSRVQFSDPSEGGYPYVRTTDGTAGIINIFMIIIISLAENAICIWLVIKSWKRLKPRDTTVNVSIIGQPELEVTSQHEENSAFEHIRLSDVPEDTTI